MIMGERLIGRVKTKNHARPNDTDKCYPETNSLHLKIDGWNTDVSFWDDLFFRGHVSFGEY